MSPGSPSLVQIEGWICRMLHAADYVLDLILFGSSLHLGQANLRRNRLAPKLFRVDEDG